ncbi:MAG: hypothetical protein AAFY91_06680 [Bacteroidota bacterium]
MSRRKRAIGVNDLLKRKFDLYDFDGKWRASFGSPEKNFRALVYGDSGNGKTEFVVQLAKYLARFGKVYFDSFEQGISQSLKDAFIRNDMHEVAGNLVIGDKDSFEDLYYRMGARNSPKFCIIDSLDYMDLTADQYRQLVERYPHKSFIIISWSAGRKPKTQAAKDILYMVDIKIRVYEYKAFVASRFGGCEPYVIWPEYWERKAQQAEEKAASQTDKKPPMLAKQDEPAKPSGQLFSFSDESTDSESEGSLPLYQSLI